MRGRDPICAASLQLVQKKIVDRLEDEIEEEASGVFDGSEGVGSTDLKQTPVPIRSPTNLFLKQEQAEEGKQLTPLQRHLQRYKSIDDLKRQPSIARY